MRLLFALYLFVLYVLAVGCLAFPRTIQGYAIRATAQGITGRLPVLRSYVESRQYLVSVRTVGLIALLAALFLTFAALRRGG
jgi:hypothetical protein